MKRFLLLPLFLCMLMAFPTGAMAQSGDSQSQNYVGLTTGLVSDKWLEGKLDSNDNTANNNDYQDLDLSRGYMVSLRLGRTAAPPQDFAAIELEGLIIDGTDVEDDPFYYREFGIGSDVNASADISLNALMTNLYLRDPAGTLHPYLGFGIGWAWVDMDMNLALRPGNTWPGTTQRVGRISSRDSDFALQILLGFDWDMTEKLALDVGYRYFYTQTELKDTLGTTDFDTDMTYNTHMLTIGLKYRF